MCIRDRFSSIAEYIQSGEIGLLNGYDGYSINGIVAVDKIYKFEALQEGLDDLSKKLNLEVPLKMPSKKAKSNTRKDKRHYRELLNDDMKDQISIVFAREISQLNYQY